MSTGSFRQSSSAVGTVGWGRPLLIDYRHASLYLEKLNKVCELFYDTSNREAVGANAAINIGLDVARAEA